MSSISPSSSSNSSGRSSPDSASLSPEMTTVDSFSSQVNQQLDRFRPRHVDEFDKIKTVLQTVLNSGNTEEIADLPPWIKAQTATLLKVANKSQQFVDSKEREESKALFMQKVAKKINEIEQLSPAARLKQSIESYSKKIDQCLDAFPMENEENFASVQYLLVGCLDQYSEQLNTAVESVPFIVGHRVSDLNTAREALHKLVLNKGEDNQPLFENAEEWAAFSKFLYSKIYDRMAEHARYTPEEKARIYTENAFKKEKPNYISLIDEYLNKFPTEKLEDFETNRMIWSSLLTSSPLPPNLSDELKNKIGSLGNLIVEPEDFVRPEHIDLFKQLLTAKIEEAIGRIDRMSPEKKEAKIQAYKNEKKDRGANQAIIAAHPGPTPEQSTLTPEQLSANWRAETAATLRNPLLSQQRGLTWLLNRVRTNLQEARNYGVEDLYQPPSTQAPSTSTYETAVANMNSDLNSIFGENSIGLRGLRDLENDAEVVQAAINSTNSSSQNQTNSHFISNAGLINSMSQGILALMSQGNVNTINQHLNQSLNAVFDHPHTTGRDISQRPNSTISQNPSPSTVSQDRIPELETQLATHRQTLSRLLINSDQVANLDEITAVTEIIANLNQRLERMRQSSDRQLVDEAHEDLDPRHEINYSLPQQQQNTGQNSVNAQTTQPSSQSVSQPYSGPIQGRSGRFGGRSTLLPLLYIFDEDMSNANVGNAQTTQTSSNQSVFPSQSADIFLSSSNGRVTLVNVSNANGENGQTTEFSSSQSMSQTANFINSALNSYSSNFFSSLQGFSSTPSNYMRSRIARQLGLENILNEVNSNANQEIPNEQEVEQEIQVEQEINLDIEEPVQESQSQSRENNVEEDNPPPLE